MLCTTSDIADLFGVTVPPGGEVETALLQAIVNADAHLRNFLNRSILDATDEGAGLTESLDVVASGVVVFLDHWPVDVMTSVTENGVLLVEDVDFYVNYDAAEVYRLGGDLQSHRSWHISYKGVTFVYDGGYNPVPADIVAVCAELAMAKFIQNAKGTVEGNPSEAHKWAAEVVLPISERIGEYSVTYGFRGAAIGDTADDAVEGGMFGTLSAGLSNAHRQMLQPYMRRDVLV